MAASFLRSLRSLTALASSSKMVSSRGTPHPLFSSGGVRGHFSSGGVRGHFSSMGFKDTSKTSITWGAGTKLFYIRTMYRIVRRLFKSERCSRRLIWFMISSENYKYEWMARSRVAVATTRVFYPSVNDAMNDFASIYTPLLIFVTFTSASVGSFIWNILGNHETMSKIKVLQTQIGILNVNDEVAEKELSIVKGKVNILLEMVESSQAELKSLKKKMAEEEKKKKKT